MFADAMAKAVDLDDDADVIGEDGTAVDADGATMPSDDGATVECAPPDAVSVGNLIDDEIPFAPPWA
jgi:hypothetical protein